MNATERPGRPDASAQAGRGVRASSGRWTLVVPALLLVALALLVVGLVTSGSTWLAGSLVASVLAAVLLVVERLVQRRRSASAASGPATADDDDAEPAPVSEPDSAPITDLDPPAIDPDHPDAVWVVDGRPRYHTRDCATVASLPSAPIPREQALADGFVACSLCEPGTRPVPAAG